MNWLVFAIIVACCFAGCIVRPGVLLLEWMMSRPKCPRCRSSRDYVNFCPNCGQSRQWERHTNSTGPK